jgi:hypothetical protein
MISFWQLLIWGDFEEDVDQPYSNKTERYFLLSNH